MSTKMKKVYFFLGHLPAQISHGVDLYHNIGGECIVTTIEAKEFCDKKGLRTLMLDVLPQKNEHHICSHLKNTIEFLNNQEGVIFFFDTLNIIEKITSLKKIMLFHGNSLKDIWFQDWRIPLINKCDYVTSLGPNWEKVMISRGVDENKILQIGQTRCDAIIHAEENVLAQKKVNELTNSTGKKIVAYMPTWHGPTSVEQVGKKIIEQIGDEYNLLFKPHPETPTNIIEEYDALISKKHNVIHVAENKYKELDLTSVILISDIFIVDHSSILIDCLLVNKPMIFASDKPFESTIEKYEPIKDVFDHCTKLTEENIQQINEIIEMSSFDNSKWEKSKKNIFYDTKGDSIETLKNYLIEHKLTDLKK